MWINVLEVKKKKRKKEMVCSSTKSIFDYERRDFFNKSFAKQIENTFTVLNFTT